MLPPSEPPGEDDDPDEMRKKAVTFAAGANNLYPTVNGSSVPAPKEKSRSSKRREASADVSRAASCELTSPR